MYPRCSLTSLRCGLAARNFSPVGRDVDAVAAAAERGRHDLHPVGLRRRIGEVALHVHRVAGVHVTGQHDRVAMPVRGQTVEHHLLLGGVAVPGVHVVEVPGSGRGPSGSSSPGWRARSRWLANGSARPGATAPAAGRPARAPDRGGRRSRPSSRHQRPGRIRYCRVSSTLNWASRPKREPAVEQVVRSLRSGPAQRHVLPVRAVRVGPPYEEVFDRSVALGDQPGVVVLYFVVVPGGDPGRVLVGRLQVRVRLVERVLQPVRSSVSASVRNWSGTGRPRCAVRRRLQCRTRRCSRPGRRTASTSSAARCPCAV